MRTVKLPFEIKSDPPFPLRLYKPGSEWLVELCWPEDADGHIAICGLFHSPDYEAAKSFYRLAQKIISCWQVDTIWHSEGKVTFEMDGGESGYTCSECGRSINGDEVTFNFGNRPLCRGGCK